MLGKRQADGPDVVTVADGAVQLHQGNVIVKREGVVVRVGYDLLQVPLLGGASQLVLSVQAQINFPSAGLGESEDTANLK